MNRPECVAARELLEQAAAAAPLRAQRSPIERCFGSLASVGGELIALPAWASRLHRVRYWVAAKLVLNSARHVLRTPAAA